MYGILHSPSYRTEFASDLKKKLPRIPLLQDTQAFTAFVQAGRTLAELHLNYENVPPLPEVTVTGVERQNFIVDKMRFDKSGKTENKETIVYNSAIHWIMERYSVTTDKASGITNNANDWAAEHGKPRYILDLLLSVINVSVQTVDIVAALPPVNWKAEAGLSTTYTIDSGYGTMTAADGTK